MSTIVIPGKMPTKANRYTIKINPSLWKSIAPAFQKWKNSHPGKPTWWISPDDVTKAYEEEVAWRVKAGEKRRWVNDEPLVLTVRLIGLGSDIDNIKQIPDAIEKSGIINNDRQFVRLHVERIPAKRQDRRLELEIEPIS